MYIDLHNESISHLYNCDSSDCFAEMFQVIIHSMSEFFA